MLRKRTQRLYREEGLTVRKRPTGNGRSSSEATGTGRRSASWLRNAGSGASAICFAWGCSSDLLRSPPPGRSHHSDYSLPAGMDVDVLDGHLLLALAAMPVERLRPKPARPVDDARR